MLPCPAYQFCPLRLVAQDVGLSDRKRRVRIRQGVLVVFRCVDFLTWITSSLLSAQESSSALASTSHSKNATRISRRLGSPVI